MTPATARVNIASTSRATAARRARLVAAYLAVVTVVGYLVVGTYALSVVGWILGVVAFFLLIRASEVAVTRALRRHVDTARNVTSLELYRARKAPPGGEADGMSRLLALPLAVAVAGSGYVATHTERPGRVPSAASASPVLPRIAFLRGSRGERRLPLRVVPARPRSRTQPRVTRSGSLLSTTAYCSTGNRTASGVWPEIGMAAGNRWPLGTRLHVDGYGDVTVTDRIGWGSDLDIFFGNDAGCEARADAYGRQERRVEVIT